MPPFYLGHRKGNRTTMGHSPRSVPDSSGLRVLSVHAHPDDEASKGASMAAAYAQAGAEVLVVTCTGGERGDILVEEVQSMPRAHRDLTGLRREEMKVSAKALNIKHVWLGFEDSGLPEGDPLPPLPESCFASVPLYDAAAPLVHLVRTFKPHVLITYDENGGYPHPDHIRTHQISVEAFRASHREDEYQGLGEPWTISKMYYDRAFSLERFRALDEAMRQRDGVSPFGERIEFLEKRQRDSTNPAARHRVTTHVPISGLVHLRDEALLAHRSQVEPGGFFFAVPPELVEEVYPWDDYVLAATRVHTELPEFDLFAGLHDGEGERIGTFRPVPEAFKPELANERR